MPKRLSFEDERRIIRLLFDGHSVNETADLCGVSVPTVRDRGKRFSSKAKEVGLMSAAKRYGVEQQVAELMDLSSQIKESGVTSKACIDGCKLLERIKGLGVDQSNLDGFVTEVYMEAEAQNLNPRMFLSIGNEMRRLKDETGKSYAEMVEENRGLKDENEWLRGENTRLETERRENAKALQQELLENKATKETLRWFTEATSSLGEEGVQVEDFDDLAALMENMKKMNYDTQAITQFYSQSKELEERKKKLQEKVDILKAQKEQLQKVNNFSMDRLRDNEELNLSLESLKAAGLTPSRIRDVAETVVEISARHNLSAEDALNKFIEDLKTHYDRKLGYENHIARLESRQRSLEEDIQEKNSKLNRLDELSKSKASAIQSLQNLNGLGVSNSDIIHWTTILTETATDPDTFRKMMERYGGIRGVVEEREAEIRELEAKIRILNAEILDLEENRRDLKTRIDNLNSTFLEGAEKSLDQFHEIMDEFEREFLSPETGFQAKSMNIAKNAHTIIRRFLNLRAVELDKQLEKLTSEISRLAGQAEELRDAAFKEGKILGQYRTVDTINKILLGEEIPKEEALAAMHVIVEAMSRWLRLHGEAEIADAGYRFNRSLYSGMRHG